MPIPDQVRDDPAFTFSFHSFGKVDPGSGPG
jgi:hypothetical protein